MRLARNSLNGRLMDSYSSSRSNTVMCLARISFSKTSLVETMNSSFEIVFGLLVKLIQVRSVYYIDQSFIQKRSSEKGAYLLTCRVRQLNAASQHVSNKQW